MEVQVSVMSGTPDVIWAAPNRPTLVELANRRDRR